MLLRRARTAVADDASAAKARHDLTEAGHRARGTETALAKRT